MHQCFNPPQSSTIACHRPHSRLTIWCASFSNYIISCISSSSRAQRGIMHSWAEEPKNPPALLSLFTHSSRSSKSLLSQLIQNSFLYFSTTRHHEITSLAIISAKSAHEFNKDGPKWWNNRIASQLWSHRCRSSFFVLGGLTTDCRNIIFMRFLLVECLRTFHWTETLELRHQIVAHFGRRTAAAATACDPPFLFLLHPPIHQTSAVSQQIQTSICGYKKI